MASRAYHVVFRNFYPEKFVAGYRAEIPEYAYLFNSYYNAAGDMHRRDLRGLISRPTVSEAQRYRASIDSHIDDLLSNSDESLLDEIEPILVLGIHHEQQHQELLITDIKHVLAQNPLYPVFRAGRDAALRRPDAAARRPYQFIDFEQTTAEIGHDGDGFCLRQRRAPAPSAGSRVFTGNAAGHKWRIHRVYRRQRLQPAGILVIARLDDHKRTTLERAALLDKTRWGLVEFHTLRSTSRRSIRACHTRQLFRSRRLRQLGGCASPDGVRMGTRSVELSNRRQFRRDRNLSTLAAVSAAQRTSQKKVASSANVRRRLGMDAQRLLALSRATALLPARLASTMANSCATNMSCAVVPAPRPGLIFAAPIAISFNRKNVGSSPESDSHATQHELVGRHRWARRFQSPQ